MAVSIQFFSAEGNLFYNTRSGVRDYQLVDTNLAPAEFLKSCISRSNNRAIKVMHVRFQGHKEIIIRVAVRNRTSYFGM